MKLSKNAEKLFQQLKNIDPELLKGRPDFWEKRMAKMTDEKARAYFELFEELEAEGRIIMTVKDIPGKYTVPGKIYVKEEEDWF